MQLRATINAGFYLTGFKMILEKTCNNCKKIKKISLFHKGTGKFNRKTFCKECCSERHKSKVWKVKPNYIKVNYNFKKCAQCDDLFKPTRKDNIYCSRKCGDKYSRHSRRDELNTYFKDKYKNDLNRRISTCLRSRLNKALKNNQKTGSAIRDLGCSIKEFKKYIETQFQQGMSWDNYGLKGWHIDHIKPLVCFDLTSPEELKKACHYTNLQPLWASDNISKGSCYE